MDVQVAEISLIRAKTPAQFDEARKLFEEYAASLGFDLAFQDFDQEIQNLPGEYGRSKGAILLAYLDGELAGCVALRKLKGSICEMKRLYVRPTFRRLGVGRILSEKIIAVAERIGYSSMRLDTVPQMTEAIELYKSLGFKEIPAYRHNPIEGAIFMELIFRE